MDVNELSAVPKMTPSFRANEENMSNIENWLKASKKYVFGAVEDFEFNPKKENFLDEFCCVGSKRILELVFWTFNASLSHEGHEI